MGTLTANTMTELLAKIYKVNGWKRIAGESRTIRAKSLYDLSIDGRRNKFVATPKEGKKE